MSAYFTRLLKNIEGNNANIGSPPAGAGGDFYAMLN